ncbi:hypothetical protein BHM03_00017922 [Ensete ventricosum]|nr:hypothetical protein BHM03_00017922 [Ensete ventricosum]
MQSSASVISHNCWPHAPGNTTTLVEPHRTLFLLPYFHSVRSTPCQPHPCLPATALTSLSSPVTTVVAPIYHLHNRALIYCSIVTHNNIASATSQQRNSRCCSLNCCFPCLSLPSSTAIVDSIATDHCRCRCPSHPHYRHRQ